jgi:hypothetical protein
MIIALSAAPVVPATNFRRVILSRFIILFSDEAAQQSRAALWPAS